MTKADLEKEAVEYASRWIVDEDVNSLMQEAYQDGAEPREKHIAELKKQLDLKEKALSKAKKETKRIADRVNKDKRRLIRRNAEFKAQIEKMKCCGNCEWKAKGVCNGNDTCGLKEWKLVETRR